MTTLSVTSRTPATIGSTHIVRRQPGQLRRLVERPPSAQDGGRGEDVAGDEDEIPQQRGPRLTEIRGAAGDPRRQPLVRTGQLDGEQELLARRRPPRHRRPEGGHGEAERDRPPGPEPRRRPGDQPAPSLLHHLIVPPRPHPRAPFPVTPTSMGRHVRTDCVRTGCRPSERQRAGRGSGREASDEVGEGGAEVAELGEAGGAEDGVVEDAVRRARRRPRRIELGRGDRCARASGSRPAARTTSRANSNHDTAPWLVTWWTPLRRSSASRRSTGARSAVNVGWPRWSSTNARRVVLGRQRGGSS